MNRSILRLALAVPLAWVLVYSTANWLHPGPLEYGEGVNLYWQRQVSEGSPLYPPVHEDRFPWVHNPYPPLAPLLSAGVDRLLPAPHPFAAGRALSLLAIAGAAWMLFRVMRDHATRSRRLTVVLLFLCSPVTLRAATLMRVDALGLAAALGSFFLLNTKRTTGRWAGSAALALGAVLIKPTFCAAGVVLLFRLVRERRGSAWAAALATGIPLLTAVAAWVWLREDPQIRLHGVVLQGLPRSSAHAFDLLAGFSGTHALALTGGFLGLVTGGSRLQDARVYLVSSLLILGLTLGIQGSHSGYALEIWALICLGLAHLPLPALRPAVLLGALQFLLFIPWETPPVFSRTYGQEEEPGQVRAFWPGAQDREIARSLQEELRIANGPVLSASPGLAMLADAGLTVQVFQFGALIDAGDWDPGVLRTALEDRNFDRILLKGNAETGGDPYLPQGLQTLIAEHYALHRVIGPWHLYRR